MELGNLDWKDQQMIILNDAFMIGPLLGPSRRIITNFPEDVLYRARRIEPHTFRCLGIT